MECGVYAHFAENLRHCRATRSRTSRAVDDVHRVVCVIQPLPVGTTAGQADRFTHLAWSCRFEHRVDGIASFICPAQRWTRLIGAQVVDTGVSVQ